MDTQAVADEHELLSREAARDLGQATIAFEGNGRVRGSRAALLELHSTFKSKHLISWYHSVTLGLPAISFGATFLSLEEVLAGFALTHAQAASLA